jgi:hypothetical protein
MKVHPSPSWTRLGVGGGGIYPQMCVTSIFSSRWCRSSPAARPPSPASPLFTQRIARLRYSTRLLRLSSVLHRRDTIKNRRQECLYPWARIRIQIQNNKNGYLPCFQVLSSVKEFYYIMRSENLPATKMQINFYSPVSPLAHTEVPNYLLSKTIYAQCSVVDPH